MFEKLFDLVKINLKNPKLYIATLILIIIVLLLFPYIDANFFYYNRVNSRVEILNTVSQIDLDKIGSNDILMDEYKSILSEISKQKSGSLSSFFITETNETVNQLKFITGGLLFWILGISCFFIKTFKNKFNRIITCIVMILLGALFGRISIAIPTVGTPIMNYIGFPLLLLVIIGILATLNKKPETTEDTNNE